MQCSGSGQWYLSGVTRTGGTGVLQAWLYSWLEEQTNKRVSGTIVIAGKSGTSVHGMHEKCIKQVGCYYPVVDTTKVNIWYRCTVKATVKI